MGLGTSHRVAVYIDGFNLYFGLKDAGWRWFYWLDVTELSRRLVRPQDKLVKVRYFTSRISSPEDKRLRQLALLEAYESLGLCTLHFGAYQDSVATCRACGAKSRTSTEKKTVSWSREIAIWCQSWKPCAVCFPASES